MVFSSREKKHLAFTIIILSLVFGFDDKRATFELGYWLGHLVKIFLIVTVSIVLHDLSHKLVSSKYGFSTEHRTWGIRRLGWQKEPLFPKTVRVFGKNYEIDSFPLGAIVGIVVMLFSNGTLYFAALESYELVIERIGRFGKKYVNITDYEEAKIAIVGPLVNTFLAIVFSLFGTEGLIGEAVLINALIAFYHMIPLPGLDGFKVLMGSIPLYIFTLAFVTSIAFLTKFMGPIFALGLAIALAVIFAFLFFYFRVYK